MLAASAAVVVFAGWRTGTGALCGFGLLLLAASLAGRGVVPAPALAGPLVLLEIVGWGSLGVAAIASDGRRLSRRLLGAWLASSGAVLLGLSLGAAHPGAGSALVAAGLCYKLGVVPAFSWAPLLLRHPSRRVAAAGLAAFAVGMITLAAVAPRLPDPAAAREAVLALALVTVPWAAWHVRRQWPKDRRCARSYAMVVLAGAGLLLVFIRR